MLTNRTSIHEQMQKHFGGITSVWKLSAHLIRKKPRVVEVRGDLYFFSGLCYTLITDPKLYIYEGLVRLKFPERDIDDTLLMRIEKELRLMGKVESRRLKNV